MHSEQHCGCGLKLLDSIHGGGDGLALTITPLLLVSVSWLRLARLPTLAQHVSNGKDRAYVATTFLDPI